MHANTETDDFEETASWYNRGDDEGSVESMTPQDQDPPSQSAAGVAEENEDMDTHEVYTEEKLTAGGKKKAKIEKERGMTSLEAAAARKAAEDDALMDQMMEDL